MNESLALQITIVALSVVGWIAFGYVFISFFEYLFHRHFMHRKRLPNWVYRMLPYVLDTYQAHAVEHHGIYYKEFDYEPDPKGKKHNIDIKITDTLVSLVVVAPIFVPMIWFFPLGGTIVVTMSVLHSRLWNWLHRQMHMPKDVFFRNWPLFRYLARHHFMHHKRTGKNYNVVFPLWDYIFFSVAKPKLRDIREMLRLGYLKPRSERSQARVERWRHEVELQRAERLQHAEAA